MLNLSASTRPYVFGGGLEKMMLDKPWRGLHLPLRPEGNELAHAAMWCHIGDGKLMCFCSDRWIDGQSIEETTPQLMSFVHPSVRSMLVARALPDHA